MELSTVTAFIIPQTNFFYDIDMQAETGMGVTKLAFQHR
jgi:hypothetical protein